MKERPIIFSDPMVRAILAGTKTQTRRPIRLPKGAAIHEVIEWKPEPDAGVGLLDPERWTARVRAGCGTGWTYREQCPFGVPGDTLWVRECWNLDALGGSSQGGGIGEWWYEIGYRADDARREVTYEGDRESDSYVRYFDSQRGRWRPSIHMPRWASRLTLRVTEVRAQRVQNISEEDARAEGFTMPIGVVVGPSGEIRKDRNGTARGAFLCAWDSIYGHGDPTSPSCVTQNPWVWAVSFEVVR